MKDFVPVNVTNIMRDIFIPDLTSTSGSGLTGLVNSTSGLKMSYHRDSEAAAVLVSLQAMTVGTFTDRGFSQISSGISPGMYQIGFPNSMWLANAQAVSALLWGAPNMPPIPIEFGLTGRGGVADSGSTTTTVDADRTEADTDYWKSALIVFDSGPNAGIGRRITAFNAATDTITHRAFPQAVAVGHTYHIEPDDAADLTSQAVTDIWNIVVDGTNTAIQLMRGFSAVLLGKLSGGGTTSNVFRNAPDTKDVVTATVDANGNRTVVTKDLT